MKNAEAVINALSAQKTPLSIEALELIEAQRQALCDHALLIAAVVTSCASLSFQPTWPRFGVNVGGYSFVTAVPSLDELKVLFPPFVRQQVRSALAAKGIVVTERGRIL